jgi:hypothetical protein
MRVLLTERRSCRRGSMQVWSAHAAGNPNDRDRNAEQTVPADRFARDRWLFNALYGGALAAAELFRSADKGIEQYKVALTL